MKMTLKEFLEKYPVPASRIAKKLGYSREWISGLANNRFAASGGRRKQVMADIQQYINDLGRELADVNIDASDVFNKKSFDMQNPHQKATWKSKTQRAKN